MIHLIRHKNEWVVAVDGEVKTNPSTIEVVAQWMETNTLVHTDTIDEALISMYTHNFNAAQFDKDGKLVHVGEADVEIL